MSILTTQRVARIEALINDFAQGVEFVTDAQQPLEDMRKDELVQLTKKFARQLEDTPCNDVLRAKSWAVLNELILRSTGRYPTPADQRPIIALELNKTAEHQILHLNKRDVSTGENKSNYWSVFLAMLRCMMYPTRKIDVIDKGVDSNTLRTSFYQRILSDAEPCLNALDISSQEVSDRFHWITPNEARLVTPAHRWVEGMGDDTDEENDQEDRLAP